MFFAELVAAQAAPARLFSRERLETNNLGDVSARFGMLLSRTVTCLAALVLHAAVIERSLPVSTVVIRLGNVFVAGPAGICAGIKRRVGGVRREVLRGPGAGVRLLVRSGTGGLILPLAVRAQDRQSKQKQYQRRDASQAQQFRLRGWTQKPDKFGHTDSSYGTV